ncbi:MAG: DUF262 domain-containing protein [Patescibacteria group bacterium]
MNNDIYAGSYLYSSIIDKVSTKHLIPTLQRPYVWTDKKQVKKFIEDILTSNDYYFIGSLVFVLSSNGTVGRDEIIDGQQRMITISLILIAIRDFIIKYKKETKLDSILREVSSFLEFVDSYDLKKSPRIEFYDKRTNSFYIKLLKGECGPSETETQKRMLDNYNYIYKELTKKFSKNIDSGITNFLNKIKTLKVIAISCTNNSIAYELFESINATGMSLASVDLIKNFLFKNASKDKSLLPKVENNWQKLEDIFADNRALFKTFLRHHWISKGYYISHSGLYSDVEDKCKNKIITSLSYSNELAEDAIIYVSIRNSNVESLGKIQKWKRFDIKSVKEILEFLSFLNVDQIYAPVLFFYKNESKENFKKFLNRLAAFQFLYKYVPGSPSSAEKIFAGFATKSKNVNTLFQELHSLVKNGHDEFVENFSRKSIYKESKSGDVQFILERYVFSKGGAKSFKEPTIEHIISQSDGDDDCIHEIGNLTIFELSENSKLPTKFKDKISIYKKSPYKEHQLILKYDFDKNYKKAMKRRTEDIASDVYYIFINILKTGKII